METLLVLKGLIGIGFLAITLDLLKPKVTFGVQYRIEKIENKQLTLVHLGTEKKLKVENSLLYKDEQFFPGDIVQMHSIYTHREKTIHKLKKV